MTGKIPGILPYKYHSGNRNTAQNHDRKHRRQSNDENARTGLRQTSVGEKTDPEVGQRPDTSNPLTKSGSQVRNLDYT